MQPGLRTDAETGIRYAQWVCPQCERKEEHQVGRDPNWVALDKALTTRDIVE